MSTEKDAADLAMWGDLAPGPTPPPVCLLYTSPSPRDS